MNELEEKQAAKITAKHPGWSAWCGLNGLWHARLLGSVPILMVHGDNPEDILEQIRLSGR